MAKSEMILMVAMNVPLLTMVMAMTRKITLQHKTRKLIRSRRAKIWIS